MPASVHEDVTVVVMTRDRRRALLRTVDRLLELPERPRVLVVDNGSTDGTVEALDRLHPSVDVVPLAHNIGAVARTVGVRLARTPYVAFSDDDSWWSDGALVRARDLLDAHPRLGLIAGRVLVGPAEQDDPINAVLAASPVGAAPGAPGPTVLGFLACSAVVRRQAFLEVGGFDPLLFFFGEENLLAQDMRAAGWQLCYVDGVVAHHHPALAPGGRDGRSRRSVRNAILTAWLRRPIPTALVRTSVALRQSERLTEAALGLSEAVLRLPHVVRRRRPLPEAVEREVRLVDDAA